MDPENQEENSNIVRNEEAPEQTEYSPIEQKAMDMGWKPQENYDGPPENWRSAELYVALKPFYERIEDLGQENRKIRKAAESTVQMFQNVKATEYKRALDTLKAEKKSALLDGDADRVISIDDQIDDLRESRTQAPQQVNIEPEANPEFVRWKQSNDWYTSDEDMQAWADGRAPKLHQQGKTPNQILEQLAREVKEKFPNKFSNPNRNKASAVEGRTTNSQSKKGPVMSSEEQKIMRTIVASGALTEEQYMAEFAKINK